jgi:hypothetical protein
LVGHDPRRYRWCLAELLFGQGFVESLVEFLGNYDKLVGRELARLKLLAKDFKLGGVEGVFSS